MAESLLEIKNLEAWYGQIQILHGVDLHVKKGEIISIIGPNGAGKSTVLKSIFGLVDMRKGHIMFERNDISKLRPNEIVRKGIGYVPQGRSVFPTLTVKENLEMGAYIKKDNFEKEIRYVYDKFPILYKRKDTKAGLLSGGEQQLVSIARSLMVMPSLMLLDEPSLGLSPKMKKEIFDKIKEINKDGVTILIVEQNARMSLSMSDMAYVLEMGKNKMVGDAKDLMHNKQVQHLYLGGVV